MKRLVIELNDEEASIVADILRRGGFPSEEAVVKLGLYKVADHYDIQMSTDAFVVPYNSRMRSLLEAEKPRPGQRRKKSA